MQLAELSLAAPANGLRSLLADKVLVMAMTVSIGLHITALAVRFVDLIFVAQLLAPAACAAAFADYGSVDHGVANCRRRQRS